MIKAATMCSGIGSPEQALKNLNIPHEIAFACEIDKYARQTYLANFTPKAMYTDMTKEEWDLPEQYSDLIVAGIPCQSFSLAGKRLGELDPRGLLFFDFFRYVKNQQPKVFIIENVKGLLSDNQGKTFQNWIHLLGRSMNQQPFLFNHDDSLMYNLHFEVLNSKDFGVPQNRERVFLIGVRSDLPNEFRFPIGWRLDKRLKDILESDVDEKYYLSEKAFNYITEPERLKKKYCQINGDIGLCLTANAQMNWAGDYIQEPKAGRITGINPENPKSRKSGLPTEQMLEINVNESITNTITTVQKDNVIVVGQTTNSRIAGWHENENVIGAHMGDAKRSSVSEHVYHKPEGICNTIQTAHAPKLFGHRIRRLTPLECFRLQGFPDEYIKPCSDSQTYKQAGNSITVNVMEAIIKNLLPIIS